MKISRRTAMLPLLMLAFAASGCGGDGDGGGGTLASRFTGSYVGTFQSPEGNGTLNLQVTRDGMVTSTISSVTSGTRTGTLAGSVDADGALRGTVTYADSASTVAATGAFARDTAGRITGTLTLANPDGAVTLTVDVRPGGTL